MNNSYSVSHIYDETGSAKARYHEFLQATEARRLATDARGNNQGPFNRILSRVFGTPTGLNDTLRARKRTDVKMPALAIKAPRATDPIIAESPLLSTT
jgi:hypothetical protein